MRESSPRREHNARERWTPHVGEGDRTMITVTSDDVGYSTVSVSGVLDASTVAEVCAVVKDANERAGRLVLDLLGVTSIEGNCLRRLARALREMGVNLEVFSPAGMNAESGPTTTG